MAYAFHCMCKLKANYTSKLKRKTYGRSGPLLSFFSRSDTKFKAGPFQGTEPKLYLEGIH